MTCMSGATYSFSMSATYIWVKEVFEVPHPMHHFSGFRVIDVLMLLEAQSMFS